MKKHESPFVADMVFCPKHDDQSNVIDVNQCQQCYAPGSQKDHRKEREIAIKYSHSPSQNLEA